MAAKACPIVPVVIDGLDAANMWSLTARSKPARVGRNYEDIQQYTIFIRSDDGRLGEIIMRQRTRIKNTCQKTCRQCRQGFLLNILHLFSAKIIRYQSLVSTHVLQRLSVTTNDWSGMPTSYKPGGTSGLMTTEPRSTNLDKSSFPMRESTLDKGLWGAAPLHDSYLCKRMATQDQWFPFQRTAGSSSLRKLNVEKTSLRQVSYSQEKLFYTRSSVCNMNGYGASKYYIQWIMNDMVHAKKSECMSTWLPRMQEKISPRARHQGFKLGRN
jgi:hypothetical protein